MIQTPVKEKKMVQISEAAKILGVSIDTVRRWDKSGKLHPERLNGKDRYFSLEELEGIKFTKSLSISEAAMELKMSPTTLRRLEKKGFINPGRTQSGERVYDGDVIKKFLESEYFLGEREMKETAPEPPEKNDLNKKQEESIEDGVLESEAKHLEKEDPAVNTENHLPEIPPQSPERTRLNRKLKPWQRVPEVLATIIVFLLLVTFGARNVMVSTAKNPNPPALSVVLSETEEIKPSPLAPTPTVPPTTAKNPISTASAVLSEEVAKPKMILTIKLDDGATSVNIRQKPTTNSEKIGLAKDGERFEFISENSGWYEVELATRSGFISAKYIEVREGINE